MNLILGKIHDNIDAIKSLEELQENIITTLENKKIKSEIVIEACNKLSQEIDIEENIFLLTALGLSKDKALKELEKVKFMLSKEYLTSRINIEVPDYFDKALPYQAIDRDKMVIEKWQPLGVLLHIVAGNAEGLPAYSLIEGLLMGNINILKLPGDDNGITITILLKLIEIEPRIKDYIYVYDFPSEDIESIKKLEKVSDAVVLWGGKEAVSAIRKLTDTNTKIIEWGHKLSFTYATKNGINEVNLKALARHICETDQLLCSSSQGIFLETEDMNEVHEFCEIFLDILDKTTLEYPDRNISNGLLGKITLQLYTEELETAYDKGKRVFKKGNCSIIAYEDSNLDNSIMHRNLWIRPLSRNTIIRNFKKYKNYLQTAILICDETEKDQISEKLIKSGVVRIVGENSLVDSYLGMPHDGEYPLRRYMRKISIDI